VDDPDQIAYNLVKNIKIVGDIWRTSQFLDEIERDTIRPVGTSVVIFQTCLHYRGPVEV